MSFGIATMRQCGGGGGAVLAVAPPPPPRLLLNILLFRGVATRYRVVTRQVTTSTARTRTYDQLDHPSKHQSYTLSRITTYQGKTNAQVASGVRDVGGEEGVGGTGRAVLGDNAARHGVLMIRDGVGG